MPQIPQLQIPQMGAVSGGVDFAPLANLGNIYSKARQDEANKAAIAAFQQTGDTRALLGSGDMSLIKLGTELEQQKRAQQNADRSYGLQERTHADALKYQDKTLGLQTRSADRADEAQKRADAIAARGEYQIKEVEDPDTGAKTLVRVKVLGPEGPVSTGSAGTATPPTQPGNPFNSKGGKFNQAEGAAASFADMMLQSEAVLSGVGPGAGFEGPVKPGVQGQGINRTQQFLSGVPGVGNSLTSDARKEYENAKRTFINSKLRRESGATIQDPEFLSAEKQYFPAPGDPQAVVDQKAALRRTAIAGMAREGGKSYRPELTIDEGGTVQPYRRAPAASPTSAASSTAAAPVVSPTPATASAAPPPPNRGELRDGYRFKGGDPADPANWVKAQN